MPYFVRLIVLIVLSHLVAQVGSSQCEMYSREELIEDFDYATKKLKQHPAFDILVDRERFDQEMLVLRSKVDATAYLIDFYELIGGLFALLPDDRTCALLPFGVENKILKKRSLPHGVYVEEDGKLRIKWVMNDAAMLNVGDEIYSINGVPIDDWKERLIPYLRGNTNYKYYQQIESNFDLYYNLTFPESKNCELVVLRDTSEAIQLPFVKYKKKQSAFEKHRKKPIYSVGKQSFIWLEDSVAYVDLGSYIKEKGEYFEVDIYELLFRDLDRSKVDKVIFDLRGAKGNISYTYKHFFSYLVSEPFVYLGRSIYMSDSKMQQHYRFGGIQDLMDESIEPGEPVYMDKLAHEPLETKYPFHGEVLILFDKNIESAAQKFAVISRCHGMDATVGILGGGSRVLTSEYNWHSLPNTEINILVANVFHSAWCKNLEGLKLDADYPYYPRLEDLQGNTDGQLEYALKILKSRDIKLNKGM